MQTISDAHWKPFSDLISAHADSNSAAEAEFRQALDLLLDNFLLINQSLNLTAIRDFDEATYKHLFDSVYLAAQVDLGSYLDWGTGGGFPGLPIALWNHFFRKSTHEIVLLDSTQKKIKAVRQLVDLFPFLNIDCVADRGEQFIQSRSYDSIIMRAVAPPERILTWLSGHAQNYYFFCGPDGRSLWQAYSENFGSMGFSMANVFEFSLPNGLGERSIVNFKKNSDN